jgi:hypothetical protein
VASRSSFLTRRWAQLLPRGARCISPPHSLITSAAQYQP